MYHGCRLAFACFLVWGWTAPSDHARCAAAAQEAAPFHRAAAGDPGDRRPTENVKLPPSAEAEDVRRSALMKRFDQNGDGELDRDERTRLRDAFGGIDVPMLPDQAYAYAASPSPGHTDAAHLDELDNTPSDNPITDHGATLGRVLFYDTHLSKNNAVACASCHVRQFGFSDPRRLSIGYDGGRTKRNSMGLDHIRYTHLKGQRPGLFWDERAATLEEQVLMPIQDPIEMGMALNDLEKKLQQLPYYPPLFQAAFGSPMVTSDRIAKAMAQFLRSMVSTNSKFDQAAAEAARTGKSGDFELFTAEENLGKSLFMDGVGQIAEFACAMCHVPPTFNMDKARNIGLDRHSVDAGLGALGRPSNDPFTPSNDGKFRAPSLRNVELTAPYMHDGRLGTLSQVVEHYSSGVHPHPNLGLAFEQQDTAYATSGLQLTEQQKGALVAFLKTLTDRQFLADPRFADPFVRGVEPGSR